MREILFRGKRVDNGEWAEGALIFADDIFAYICPDMTDVSYGDNGNRMRIGCWYQVDPSTVGQYTGLTANGKRIFEGDIFEWGYAGVKEFRYVVAYDADVASFVGNRHYGFVSLNGIEIEIIGNIHDHPELMEVDHE